MKVPPIKEGESLAMWRERLAVTFNLSEKVKEIVRAVSVQSYINGTNDAMEILKDEQRI